MKDFMKAENIDIVNINGDEKVELSNVQKMLLPKRPDSQKSETRDCPGQGSLFS